MTDDSTYLDGPEQQSTMTQPGGRAQLTVTGLIKRFGDVRAVSDVSFDVRKGEFVSLLGPSGCGKTTTLRMLAGFVLPDAGRIRLGERDITADPPYRRDVGLLFQNYALFPHMTVAQNVGFGPKMRGMPRAETRERLRWALELVRLSGFENRVPSELSGGQQQRVAVARVVAAGASMLLLDEPFSNLDAKLRLHMQEELRELQLRLNIATVHVTHDQEEAMMMADRVIIMNGGRIEQEGTPRQIYQLPATAFVADFMGRCNRLNGRLASAEPEGGLHIVDLGGPARLKVREECVADANGEVALFVRPEHVEVGRSGAFAGRSNVIPGVVIKSIYLGAKTNVHIDLQNGQRILAQLANRSSQQDGFPAGAEVDVRIDPGGMAPYPNE